MKKNKKIKKIPAYAFGEQNMMGVGEMAGGVGDMITGLSNEDSAGSMIGAGISGIGKGVAMGAAAGPIGMVAGGAIGGFASLFGMAKRRKAIREAKARKEQMKITQAGLANQAAAEQDYWENNTPVYTFENGGILPDLAYLDNNEVIRDDFGNIERVPNNKPGTDNHLVNASNLDSVLSDKIKRPGTNKTFAQEGKKLVNMTKGSKGKDRFARNADKLNQINANTMYEQLLAEQEAVKAKKGIKPKVKGIPAYEDGKGKKDVIANLNDVVQTWNPEWSNALVNANIKDRDESIRRMYNRDVNSVAGHGRTLGPGIGYGANDWYIPKDVNGITGKTIPMLDEEEFNPDLIPANTQAPQAPNVKKPVATTVRKSKSIPTTTITPKQAPLLDVEEFNPDLNPDAIYAPLLNVEDDGVTLSPDEIKKPKSKFNFNFSSLTGLSPILYNFAQSLKKPEYEETVLNPYAAASMRSMAKRRLNIEPTLAANRRNRAINRNNMARLNPNTGMNLAYGNQLAASEYSRNADVYAARDNANNQYLADFANMGNNFGQQFVQAQTLANDLNARNRAAARNFGSTAAGQLGQWTQTKEKMYNQARRDRQILPYLKNFLRYGTANSVVDNLIV